MLVQTKKRERKKRQDKNTRLGHEGWLCEDGFGPVSGVWDRWLWVAISKSWGFVRGVGRGSKLNRRGKPQVLVPMFPLTRATHFGIPAFFKPQPFMYCFFRSKTQGGCSPPDGHWGDFMSGRELPLNPVMLRRCGKAGGLLEN